MIVMFSSETIHAWLRIKKLLSGNPEYELTEKNYYEYHLRFTKRSDEFSLKPKAIEFRVIDE